MEVIMAGVGIFGAKGGQVLFTLYFDDCLPSKGAA